MEFMPVLKSNGPRMDPRGDSDWVRGDTIQDNSLVPIRQIVLNPVEKLTLDADVVKYIQYLVVGHRVQRLTDVQKDARNLAVLHKRWNDIVG